MIQKAVFIILALTPFVSSSQSIKSGTQAYDQIMEADCDTKLFTKYEERASFKVSKEALEDSITVYLKAHNAWKDKRKFRAQFILTKKSHIVDFERYRGDLEISDVEKAVLRYSELWLPARTNNLEICAYVKCEFEAKGDRLTVTVLDPNQKGRAAK